MDEIFSAMLRAVDTHPGGEQLKHYWLHGEGAAKWKTWTQLYHHLSKYLSPGYAKRTAAEWFHERYGYWPGDHQNRSIEYGTVAITGDEWLDSRAQEILTKGLPDLPESPDEKEVEGHGRQEHGQPGNDEGRQLDGHAGDSGTGPRDRERPDVEG